MKLERVTIEEIVEKADEEIRNAAGWTYGTPIADWIRDEEARRLEAEEAFRAEAVVVAGVELEVGAWYSIVFREYGSKRRRRHGCRYTGKKIRRTWISKGEELVVTFQAWGSKPDRHTFPRALVFPIEGLLEVEKKDPPAGMIEELAGREEEDRKKEDAAREWRASRGIDG